MQSLAHSIKYKKLDDDLYPFKRWKKEKRTVLKTLDYSKLLTPIRRTLDAKEVELNKLYKVVNQSVIKGENSFVKIKTNKKGEKVWKLTPYEAEEDTEDSILSTDKHGKNSLNFALFDFVEMIFCPRIPKAHREGLWGFGTAADYKDYIIKPTHFVDMNLIESEWDNMQRMAASIITGEASPCVVIRNLSSKEYSSRTKRAFVQYNNIVKSHFILQYIHDAEFRRAVTDALNRGEKYNSLYPAITLFNNGQLKGTSEIEMEIWNQCTRLIAAIIHYYNSYVLNELYIKAKTKEEKAFISQFLPTAWGHVNLLGHYEFCVETKADWIVDWIKNFDWKETKEKIPK